MDGAHRDTSIAWPELVFSLSSTQEERAGERRPLLLNAPLPTRASRGEGENFCWLCQDASLSGLSARNAEPLHLGDQRRALQPESGGRAFRASDDPIGFSQRLDDMFAFGSF